MEWKMKSEIIVSDGLSAIICINLVQLNGKTKFVRIINYDLCAAVSVCLEYTHTHTHGPLYGGSSEDTRPQQSAEPVDSTTSNTTEYLWRSIIFRKCITGTSALRPISPQ